MDLQDEKEKAKYQFRLDLSKLIIDRLVIGVGLLAVGFVANGWLEDHKSRLAADRWISERQLQAIDRLREAYAEVTAQFFRLSDPANTDTKSDGYEKAIEQFGSSAKEKDVLYSRRLKNVMNCHSWLHSALLNLSAESRPAYRDFVYALNADFHDVTRGEVVQRHRDDQLRLASCEKMGGQQAHRGGAQKLLENVYGEWASGQHNR